MNNKPIDFIEIAKTAITTEQEALELLKAELNEDFA